MAKFIQLSRLKVLKYSNLTGSKYGIVFWYKDSTCIPTQEQQASLVILNINYEIGTTWNIEQILSN